MNTRAVFFCQQIAPYFAVLFLQRCPSRIFRNPCNPQSDTLWRWSSWGQSVNNTIAHAWLELIDRSCIKKEKAADNIKYRHLGKLYKHQTCLTTANNSRYTAGGSHRRSTDSGGDENWYLCRWSITGHPADTTSSCSTDGAIVNYTMNRPGQNRTACTSGLFVCLFVNTLWHSDAQPPTPNPHPPVGLYEPINYDCALCSWSGS